MHRAETIQQDTLISQIGQKIASIKTHLQEQVNAEPAAIIEAINGVSPEEHEQMRELFRKRIILESLRSTTLNFYSSIRSLSEYEDRIMQHIPASSIEYLDDKLPLLNYYIQTPLRLAGKRGAAYTSAVLEAGHRRADFRWLAESLGISLDEWDFNDPLLSAHDQIVFEGQMIFDTILNSISSVDEHTPLVELEELFNLTRHHFTRWAESVATFLQPRTANFERYTFNDQTFFYFCKSQQRNGKDFVEALLAIKTKADLLAHDPHRLGDEPPTIHYRDDILSHTISDTAVGDIWSQGALGSENPSVNKVNFESGRVWQSVTTNYAGQRTLPLTLFFRREDIAWLQNFYPVGKGAWQDEREIGIEDVAIPLVLAVHATSPASIMAYEGVNPFTYTKAQDLDRQEADPMSLGAKYIREVVEQLPI